MLLTHRQIVDRQGVSLIAERMGLPVQTVRMWQYRKRVPSEHWARMAALGLASLEELALAEAQPAGGALRRARAA